VIRPDHFLCYDHYADWEEDLIDECPNCSKFKNARYDLCRPCEVRASSRQQGIANRPRQGTAARRYQKEHSEAWEARDKGTSEFFVYLLKLDGGKYYVGHTRNLRARLSEHRDNLVKSTASQNPRLQWFASLPSRDSAASTEVELKKLNDSNPRMVRELVIGFHDLIREIDMH